MKKHNDKDFNYMPETIYYPKEKYLNSKIVVYIQKIIQNKIKLLNA